jgi:putative (di)nucleoside polyphosphate hydrolase
MGRHEEVYVNDLPYRLNVGAALFNAEGRVFIGRRTGLPEGAPETWQMPQGGIDAGEDPAAAVLRELREEIGTDDAEIIGEHPAWLTYDLPENALRSSFRGRFRGQRQKWFALRFLGRDSDIALDRDPHPEFSAWRWAELPELPDLIVPFKRPVYESVVAEFARFAELKLP